MRRRLAGGVEVSGSRTNSSGLGIEKGSPDGSR
jgi:hypothetical protein